MLIADINECSLCGEDCESVGHFLCNCPAYSVPCIIFRANLKTLGKELSNCSAYSVPCIIFRAFLKTLGKELSALKAEILWGNHVSFWGQSFRGVIMRSCCA